MIKPTKSPKASINLLPMDGTLVYCPRFLSSIESAKLFEILKNSVPWTQETINIFGKSILQPRLTAWYAEKNYRYSGLTLKPNAWHPQLVTIKSSVEIQTGVTYNSVLLNYYRDENDSVGWHSDNEKELGLNPIISALSLGAEREILFQHRINKKIKISIILKSGSLLVMRNETQNYWVHSIPKSKSGILPRISLTFRTIL
jgi:alkylated DNA repair dioxygenase AlkB